MTYEESAKIVEARVLKYLETYLGAQVTLRTKREMEAGIQKVLQDMVEEDMVEEDIIEDPICGVEVHKDPLDPSSVIIVFKGYIT